MTVLHSSVSPITHAWSLEEYDRMANSGIFERRRVELIGGVIYDMTPQGDEHAQSIMVANTCLVLAYSKTHYVRVQLPLYLPPDSAPEPDFAVVARESVDGSQPQWASVVMEVSFTSLKFDLTEKLSLYAKAQIPEYWVANLPKERLEVYRNPETDPSAHHGAGYRDKIVLDQNQTVAALFAPHIPLKVSELLGQP